LSVDVEATLKFARENLSLDAAHDDSWIRKGEWNCYQGWFEHSLSRVQSKSVAGVSRFPRCEKDLQRRGWWYIVKHWLLYRRGVFQLLQQLVTRLRLDGRRILLNNCLGHRVALVLPSATKSVDFIHKKLQPDLEELFRFIWFSNSAVRHKSMQAAFAGLGLDDVAMLGAFFTRWLSHGRVLTNMHKGLAGMLTGLKDIANNKNIDYAKASGLRYQVQWLFRIHRDSWIVVWHLWTYRYLQKTAPGQGTDACWQCGTLPCLRQGSGGHGSRCEDCPALLLFIDQIKTWKVSSEYVRELTQWINFHGLNRAVLTSNVWKQSWCKSRETELLKKISRSSRGE
jgi:hypothetical protein